VALGSTLIRHPSSAEAEHPIRGSGSVVGSTRAWVVPSPREAGSLKEATMADTTNTTTVRTAEVVRCDPVIITERVAVSAFIAGYTDLILDAQAS
jgi:hypothetical protein